MEAAVADSGHHRPYLDGHDAPSQLDPSAADIADAALASTTSSHSHSHPHIDPALDPALRGFDPEVALPKTESLSSYSQISKVPDAPEEIGPPIATHQMTVPEPDLDTDAAHDTISQHDAEAHASFAQAAMAMWPVHEQQQLQHDHHQDPQHDQQYDQQYDQHEQQHDITHDPSNGVTYDQSDSLILPSSPGNQTAPVASMTSYSEEASAADASYTQTPYFDSTRRRSAPYLQATSAVDSATPQPHPVNQSQDGISSQADHVMDESMTSLGPDTTTMDESASHDTPSDTSRQRPGSLRAGTHVCKHPGCTAPPFMTQYLLNSHANVHSSKRDHFCPVEGCPRSVGGKGFKRKNEMIRHGLVHTSPGYICPFCPGREHKYPRPDNLQRHVRVHHMDKDKDDPVLRDVLAQRLDGIKSRRRRTGP